jgi:hypothetical protein
LGLILTGFLGIDGSVARNLRSALGWRLRPITQEFSIGILRGRTIPDIAKTGQVIGPVLTRAHVTDVPAAFVADPFMCRLGTRWYMFFEVLNKRGWKGEIGLATSDDGIDWEYQQIVLAEDFHVSYPYVFEWDGDYYMIPEGRQGGAVILYVADRFPYGWRRITSIVGGGDIVDASILRFDDHWWLFGASIQSSGPPQLRLFHASELQGPWKEHRCSPLVSRRYDIVRPCGRVLVVEGRPIRFAQGLKPAYGSDVHAIRIKELCKSGYVEEYLGESPLLSAGQEHWNSGGMHHIDAHELKDGTCIACVDGWSIAPRKLANLLTTARYPRTVGAS